MKQWNITHPPFSALECEVRHVHIHIGLWWLKNNKYCEASITNVIAKNSIAECAFYTKCMFYFFTIHTYNRVAFFKNAGLAGTVHWTWHSALLNINCDSNNECDETCVFVSTMIKALLFYQHFMTNPQNRIIVTYIWTVSNVYWRADYMIMGE